MTSWRCWVCCAFVLLAAGCDPYSDYKLKGEFNAGSVDPFNFPPPYRGAGASRSVAGSGNGFTAVRAFSQGLAIEYYLFPYSPSQVVAPGYVYSASAISNQTANALGIRSFPLAYVFDPPGTSNPFPAQQQCGAPSGYVYDPRRDAVRYDEQGSILTALPEATFGAGSLPTWTYVPTVAEVPVASNGEPCQDIKSERTLLTRNDVNVPKDGAGNPSPDGRYLAWALIDPGSGVYHVGETATTSTGVDIQRWGWYQQYLAAYIEGGYIPIDTAASNRFKAQRLYIPNRIGNSPGRVGAGYDVLDAPRGDTNYSPICEVRIYTPMPPVTSADQLPKSASDIGTTTPPTPPPAGAIVPSDVIPPFVFCLQPK